MNLVLNTAQSALNNSKGIDSGNAAPKASNKVNFGTNYSRDFIEKFSREISACRKKKDKNCESMLKSLSAFESDKYDKSELSQDKKSRETYIVNGLKNIVMQSQNKELCQKIKKIFENNESQLVGPEKHHLYTPLDWKEIKSNSICLQQNNLSATNYIKHASEDIYAKNKLVQFEKVETMHLAKLVNFSVLETSWQMFSKKTGFMNDINSGKSGLILFDEFSLKSGLVQHFENYYLS